MRSITTFLSFVLFAALSATAQIAIVNNGTPANTSCAAAPGTCTPTAINTVGATLITCSVFGYNRAINPCTSTPSNTWHAVGAYANSSSNVEIYYAYAPSTNSSQSFSCDASYGGCFITAWNGTLTTSSVLGVFNGGVGGCINTDQVQPGSITPSATGSLLVSVAMNDSTASILTPSVDSGFSILNYFVFNSGTNFPGVAGYLIDSSASAINPKFTMPPTASDCVATIAEFLAAAPPPAANPGRGSIF